MQILITGGTGLIGSALVRLWQAEHKLLILSRTGRKSANSNIHYINALSEVDFNTIDVVVNLAGEPIAKRRWSEKQKNLICQSRWQLTEALSKLISQASTPPKLLISGSATGYYGRQGNTEITEEYDAFFPEFTHDICAKWENLAMQASSDKTRVALLRTGMVLAEDGGALAKMLPPFKMALGGVMGDGTQYMSWIHLDDMVNLINFIMQHDDISGPVNAVAPRPVTNKVFTAELAKRIKRPAVLPMPAFMASLLFGEMADILLYGQRVVPQKLLKAGFTFRYPQLSQALAALTL
ncbi:TIGR01777 family oxidoreductase [Alishewanella sp. HL-SH05]|uniref:TIGR01777 family oxidoreductase n=1 Tax=Alishewanella sp. HL-SH05 TaxID=3461145 RepID=UPI00404287E3